MKNEITAIVRYFNMWFMLGWYDIKQIYRRSLIGPFWITISTGVMVGSIGLMFSIIFKSPVKEFLPYFAVGQIIWQLISMQLNDACTMFVQYQSIIKQISVPLSVHVLRKLWHNFIQFLHNFLIVIAVLISRTRIFEGIIIYNTGAYSYFSPAFSDFCNSRNCLYQIPGCNPDRSGFPSNHLFLYPYFLDAENSS